MAGEQHGLVTRAQATALGLTAPGLQRRVGSGAWERVQPGVFALRGTPDTTERALLAATLAAGGVAGVSHRAAAERWGQKRQQAAPREISSTRERGLRLAGVTVHRSRDLHPDHITTVDGLPVTTAVRTLVDLGQVEPWFVVRDFFEHLIARQTTTVPAAHAALLLHSRRGRSGCGALRRVLDERALLDRPTESVLEAAFADLCRRAGLPRASYQYRLRLGGRERWVDFAYPDLKIAIEVDGFEHHATVTGFADDRVRGNDLALAGWTVLHFTWAQVIHRPGYVVSVVRRALLAATAAPHQNWA